MARPVQPKCHMRVSPPHVCEILFELAFNCFRDLCVLRYRFLASPGKSGIVSSLEWVSFATLPTTLLGILRHSPSLCGLRQHPAGASSAHGSCFVSELLNPGFSKPLNSSVKIASCNTQQKWLCTKGKAISDFSLHPSTPQWTWSRADIQVTVCGREQ